MRSSIVFIQLPVAPVSPSNKVKASFINSHICVVLTLIYVIRSAKRHFPDWALMVKWTGATNSDVDRIVQDDMKNMGKVQAI